jgi:hypothetical protein
MALSIKNEQVLRLARELAGLTGNSVTGAIGAAVEARLLELRRNQASSELAARLLAIGRDCARRAPADWLTRDFDQELYGQARHV